MSNDSIAGVVAAIIGGIASIIVAQISVKKAVQKKEIENATELQSLRDRLAQVEKQQEQYILLVDKLNSIENTIIAVKKDIEFLKERNK